MKKSRKLATHSFPDKPQVFFQDDLIVPCLRLPSPTPITIHLYKDSIVLFIGPRDIEWDRKTGRFTGCGTVVDPEWAKRLHKELRKRGSRRPK